MDNLTRRAWLDAIEDRYGLRLRHENDVYVQRGFVYAGSEYVARLGRTADPADAIEWTASIGAFERIGGTVKFREFGRQP
jgi:hypothetical protein